MTSRRVVVLFDDRVEGGRHWIATGLSRRGYRVALLDISGYSMRNRRVRWRKAILWAQYLGLAARGLRLARAGSAAIVATNFQVGAVTAALARCLRGARPQVVALNAIIRDRGTAQTWMRAWIYKTASGSGRLYLTVNSDENAVRYQRQFGFDKQRTSVVNDPWAPHYPVEEISDSGTESVFCGGEAGRDWETFLAVARRHPAIRFVGVAMRNDWTHTEPLPPNVDMRFDLPEETFYECVGRARLVLLPLKGSATSGLIVLLRSILMGRLVLATRTPATEGYYPSGRSDLLVAPGDPGALSALVDRYWEDAAARRDAAAAVKAHILEHRSPESYLDAIAAILKTASG